MPIFGRSNEQRKPLIPTVDPIKRVERCTECRGLSTLLVDVELVEQAPETLGFKQEREASVVSKRARLCAECVRQARHRGGMRPAMFVPFGG